jgi:hypothetical protein
VSWPGKFSGCAGQVRHQFAHAVDVLPTVLELAGMEAPSEIEQVQQSRIDGVSFAYLLDPGGAETTGRHLTQHFEMFGSRAVYHDGWKAVTFHPVGPIYGDGLEPNALFEDDVWELYHVAEDVSETDDVASQHPERLGRMIDLWWEEARQNDVLPLDNRVLWTLVHPKPDHRRPRDVFRYFAGGAQVPETVAVNVRNRSHSIHVEVLIPDGVIAQGVLIALGSVLGGWSLFALEGSLHYVHNLYGKERHLISTEETLESGSHDLGFVFEKDDGPGGKGALSIDGRIVTEAVIPQFTPAGFNGVGAGLTCGYEWGPAIGTGYEAPFPFNGTITKASVEVTGPVVRDPLAELAAILSEQ